MAYRRKQGLGRPLTFKEETYSPPEDGGGTTSLSSSLAVQAIMASAAHRHSEELSSMGSSNEGVGSLWGVLARKAKTILEDPESELPYSPRPADQGEDNPTLQQGLDVQASSMDRTGNTVGNAMDEGRAMVENKTVDFIRDQTRKLQTRRKGVYDNVSGTQCLWQQLQSTSRTSQEDQLKASRDVAMATAAKAKLLLRELKKVKADLAFARQRCSQLEEENKNLREAREKGVYRPDDDMIRLQLEILLAEKARLAHENSVFARENRFLREIVEYHQLTKQDVIYFEDELGILNAEVSQAYDHPMSISPSHTSDPPSPASHISSLSRNSSLTRRTHRNRSPSPTVPPPS